MTRYEHGKPVICACMN